MNGDHMIASASHNVNGSTNGQGASAAAWGAQEEQEDGAAAWGSSDSKGNAWGSTPIGNPDEVPEDGGWGSFFEKSATKGSSVPPPPTQSNGANGGNNDSFTEVGQLGRGYIVAKTRKRITDDGGRSIFSTDEKFRPRD